MADLLGIVLEGLTRLLVELVSWIPSSRLRSITAAWAWAIGACLAIGLFSLIGALWLGHPDLYRLALGAFIATCGFVCIAAFVSRPDRDG
jgi:hypothetical protein